MHIIKFIDILHMTRVNKCRHSAKGLLRLDRLECPRRFRDYEKLKRGVIQTRE